MLAKKFFSYEQTTESLLESIGAHERSIVALQQRKEELSQKYSSLVHENLVINDCKGSKADDTLQQRKEALSSEINDKQLKKEEIMTWVKRRFETMVGKQVDQSSTEKTFKALCDLVKAEAVKLAGVSLEGKVQTFGVRLKKLVREKSMEEISMKLRETEEMNESNLIEEEFMNTERQNLYKKGFNIKPARRESHLR